MRRLQYIGWGLVVVALIYLGVTSHNRHPAAKPPPALATATPTVALEPLTVKLTRSCAHAQTEFTLYIINNADVVANVTIKVNGTTAATLLVAAHGAVDHAFVVANNANGGKTVVLVSTGSYTAPQRKSINC
jgi:hypothetical protein